MAYDPNEPTESVTVPLGQGDGAADGDGDSQADIEAVLGDICPSCGEDAAGR